MNPTTDPALRSYVPVAADSPFPIQNIPFGVIRRAAGEHAVGVALGDFVVDLAVLEAVGAFTGPALKGQRVFGRPSLNAFLSLGKPAWTEARATISQLLRADVPTLRDNAALREKALVRQSDVTMLLPAEI